MNTGAMLQSGGVKRFAFLMAVVAPAGVSGGCMQAMPDRADRMTRGHICYFDGAGGGSAVSNWAGSVRSGMLAAGHNGARELFKWNTGLGALADQHASVAYKKSKAAECAQSIQTSVKAAC